MYKDQDKQREANRKAQAKFKAKQGITSDRVLPDNNSNTLHPAIVAGINRLTISPDGTVDEQARAIRMANALNYQRMYPGRQYTGVGVAIPANPVPVRVSLPGDADYKPLCQFTRDWMANYD